MSPAPNTIRPTTVPDPGRLTVLGHDTVADRRIRFGTHAELPRLWIAFTDHRPALLGYVSGLVVGRPTLWISEPAHEPWAHEGATASELKEAAERVWASCLRVCDGWTAQIRWRISCSTSGALTPELGQPPKWCSATTSCESRDSTGDPDEPNSVSQ